MVVVVLTEQGHHRVAQCNSAGREAVGDGGFLRIDSIGSRFIIDKRPASKLGAFFSLKVHGLQQQHEGLLLPAAAAPTAAITQVFTQPG